MTAHEKGLAVVPPQQVQAMPQYAPAPAIDWDEVERLVNELYIPNATRADRVLLMAWCRRVQLDPLTQDVVLIQHRPFVTLAGLTKVADRSGHMDGCTATSELVTAGPHAGKYVATATVWRNDRAHPTVMQARQWEHERIPPSGKGDSPWQKSPAAMTEKCALARALRLSFSLVGLTAAEEVGYDEESEESNAGKVVVIQPDQGRPGRAPAQLPAAGPAARVAQAGEPAAGAAEAGEVPQELGWDAFWRWARERGLKGRDELDVAIGGATIGMTPAAIKAAILAKAPGSEKRPLTADETLEWLGAQERPLKAQERACKHLFSLSEDRAELEAWYATAQVLCHQDAVDGAWFDRTTDLGWHTEVVPAVEEEPTEAAPGPRPTIEEIRDAVWNGDLDSDVPFK